MYMTDMRRERLALVNDAIFFIFQVGCLVCMMVEWIH